MYPQCMMMLLLLLYLLLLLSRAQLHDVLVESDRSMRVVKDLFGDDPKVRKKCTHPFPPPQ